MKDQMFVTQNKLTEEVKWIAKQLEDKTKIIQ